ncbi:hypothetical protein CPC16_004611 [Podila verticillata]|nr:hypothetical protein CPC16_004611 [Podila verticillata]
MQPTLGHPPLSSPLGLQIPSHTTQRDASGRISSSVSTSSLSSSGSSTLYGNDSDEQLHLSLDTLKFGKTLRSSSATSSPTGSDCTRNSPRDEDMDIDLDSDHTAESSPISMSHNTYIPTSVGLYLNTAGSRSNSTPNLHAVNDLLASPVNSPPGSPRMPTPVAYSSPPLLSIEPSRHADEDNMAIVLSPQSSPESSPTLASRPLPLPITPPTRSPRQRVNTPTPTPVSPLVPRALTSAKNMTVNRNSVITLFDTSSSMTLPTDLGRKSVPLEVPGVPNMQRLSGMFVEAPMDANASSMTLAEFRLYDVYPKRQRRLLTHLQRLDSRLHEEGVLKKLTKEQLKGKPDKELLKPDRKSMNNIKKNGQGFMAQRMPRLLQSRKIKRRTRPVILSNIEMAIKDKQPELAMQYIALLPSSALKKRKKKGYSELNNCMLLAMIYRMERVAIELVDRGFPSDVNYPILGRSRDDSWMRLGKKPSFEYPSYFLVAVGLGMGHLVKAMIKNANLNQAWYGLTPLLLATTLNECTSATCPPPTLPPAKLASMLSKGQNVRLDFASQTLISQLPSSFNKSTDSPKIPNDAPFPQSIVSMLLEYGADPNLGITLQQYAWANKIKGMGVMRRRKSEGTTGASNLEKLDNPMEHVIAAKRLQSGRQWIGPSELKEKKAARVQQESTPKKRFSSEMQEYWKGKFIHPVELAIASGNLDSARSIMQRLGPNSLKNSSFGMLLQNDVMLTLSLVKSGCPASQYDIHGCTPLHLAARRGHMEMVMVLLQLGGDVDGQGERQWTPLHESISQNHVAISSLLVACGADLEVKNAAGETPEDLGRRRGLSPEVLASHLDPTRAKDNNSAFLLSFANSTPQETTVSTVSTGSLSRRSTTVSLQMSYEQLSASALKSLLMLSSSDNRHFNFDHNRRSQTFHSVLDKSNIMTGPDSRSSSPTTNSPDSPLDNLLSPTRSGSMNNFSVNSDKKKKVRGFLKSIFNK